MLMPLTRNTQQNRTGLLDAVNKITSKELTTNITDAIRKGFDELNAVQQRRRILIMLSDGKIDLLSKDKDEAAPAELKLLLPEPAKSNIKGLYGGLYRTIRQRPA
jgi:hypothetical protein